MNNTEKAIQLPFYEPDPDEKPRESRQIFMRRYYFFDSIEEIADRYGVTQSKVKTRLHRTRTKLYDYLLQEGIAI